MLNLKLKQKKTLTRIIWSIGLLAVIGALGWVLIRNLDYYPKPTVSDGRDCHNPNAPYLDPNVPLNERVNDLLSRMTLQEKIGQMVLIEKNSIHNLNDITKYNLGALLSGGGAGPKKDTPSAWLQMIDNFQAAAKKTCWGIPLLYGIDAVHGHANVLGATVFPHAIGLGATRNPDLVRQVAQATAEEMAATGIYWNFAPNLDVVKDIRWGKTFETFGSDTANVSQLGLAYLEGTQDSSKGYFNVLANPKHFIGGGDMTYGTSRNKDFKVEEGNITIDENTLRQVHLTPFQAAVADGARVVMVGTGSWQGNLNTANHYLLTDVLKTELGFSGFVVSDWYGVYQISGSKYESLKIGINAGIDMVMTPFTYKDFIANMQNAVANGDITQERIDDAVKRILTVKFETGLFDRPQADASGLPAIGNEAHRLLAREAVRQSLVLLKNKNATLPLSPTTSKIVLAGSAADNLGRQAGGWTTEWQGIDGNFGLVGTTILQGIKNTISPNTKFEYNLKGYFSTSARPADIGIAVVGEEPYAEGWGDNEHPALSADDLAIIKKVKAASKKLVVIIVSGRPLDITAQSRNWDAVIAAWLPGSEGAGIADVLFGDYKFTGKLPVEWDID